MQQQHPNGSGGYPQQQGGQPRPGFFPPRGMVPPGYYQGPPMGYGGQQQPPMGYGAPPPGYGMGPRQGGSLQMQPGVNQLSAPPTRGGGPQGRGPPPLQLPPSLAQRQHSGSPPGHMGPGPRGMPVMGGRGPRPGFPPGYQPEFQPGFQPGFGPGPGGPGPGGPGPGGPRPGMPPVAFNKGEIGAYVGNLARDVGNDFLTELLTCCGPLVKLARVEDPTTNELKAFGIATFPDAKVAAVAVRVLDGLELGGRKMVVKVGKKEQPLVAPFLDAAAKAAAKEADAAGGRKRDGGKKAESGKADEGEDADAKTADGDVADADAKPVVKQEEKEVEKKTEKTAPVKTKDLGDEMLELENSAREKVATAVGKRANSSTAAGRKKEETAPAKESAERADGNDAEGDRKKWVLDLSYLTEERDEKMEAMITDDVRRFRMDQLEKDRIEREEKAARLQRRVKEEREMEERRAREAKELAERYARAETQRRLRESVLDTVTKKDGDRERERRHERDRDRDRNKDRDRDSDRDRDRDRDRRSSSRSGTDARTGDDKTDEKRRRDRKEESSRESSRRSAERDRGSRKRGRSSSRERSAARGGRSSAAAPSAAEEEAKRKKEQQEKEAAAAEADRKRRRRLEVLATLGVAGADGELAAAKAQLSAEEAKVAAAAADAAEAALSQADAGAASPAVAASAPVAAKDDPKERDRLLADAIPKDRDALFAYPVDWGAVERHDIVSTKMRPWVVKKIVEYLGEEEPTLIDFVVSKLRQRSPPNAILAELRLVLEEDADVFVAKMWRMLIFCVGKAAMSTGTSGADNENGGGDTSAIDGPG